MFIYFLIFQRFPNQNMCDMQRDQLLKLYSMYATPKAKRLIASSDVEMECATDQNSNTEKDRKNGLKRSKHPAPTVETVTNACKKICLINTERVSTQKRHCETPESMVNIFISFFSERKLKTLKISGFKFDN